MPKYTQTQSRANRDGEEQDGKKMGRHSSKRVSKRDRSSVTRDDQGTERRRGMKKRTTSSTGHTSRRSYEKSKETKVPPTQWRDSAHWPARTGETSLSTEATEQSCEEPAGQLSTKSKDEDRYVRYCSSNRPHPCLTSTQGGLVMLVGFTSLRQSSPIARLRKVGFRTRRREHSAGQVGSGEIFQ